MTGDPEMGYVDSFQFYINDMKFFYDTYLKPNQHEKVYLIAHSMGGAIGMTYLEQFPDDFDAAAFSSPMLGLKSYVCPVARLVNSKEPKYGPGQSGYNREEEVFEGNTLTGSGVRYKRAVDAFDQVPQARLGGASIQWVQSSCRQFDDMFKHIGSIRTPFILFSAENEQVVNPHAHQKFVEKALQLGKECEAYLVKNARHELLVEKDEQRTGVINSSLNFFAKY
jgi:lysophospholipase